MGLDNLILALGHISILLVYFRQALFDLWLTVDVLYIYVQRNPAKHLLTPLCQDSCRLV
jgi:hypothetical protein